MFTKGRMGMLGITLVMVMSGFIPVSEAQYGDDFIPVSLNQGSSAISFRITPDNPKPNTVVTIEVRTVIVNLRAATIAWLENGELVSSGIGKSEYTTVTGPLGSSKTVTVVIQGENDVVYEKEFILKSASVDLLWESSTNVPPFYKGKALYSLLGSLKIVALPEVGNENGQLIDPEQLLYTWTKNGVVLGKESGYGKNSLVSTLPGLRMPLTIKVDVATIDGIIVASDTATIQEASPKILMYENNPLYGILFNREVGSLINLQGNEISLEVFPYFYNTRDRNLLTYTWKVNGILVEGFQGPFIVLRKDSDSPGEVRLSLEVKNPNLFTEFISRSININFGN